MYVVRHLVRLLSMLAALAVSTGALANIGGPRWACWYAPNQLSIQCLLAHAPTEGIDDRAAAVASRIDRRLPALVQTIWGSPEQLAGAAISIPLFSLPFDMDFVGLLARSVMCGGRKDCSVAFDANADGLAPVRAAALESGSSEAAVMDELAAQGLRLAEIEAPATPPLIKKRRRV